MKYKTEKLSIKAKLLAGTSVVAIFAFICMGILLYQKSEQHFLSQQQNQVQRLAEIGVSVLDVELLEQISEGMEEDPI